MTPQRQIYLANIGTKERIIRKRLEKEKAWLSDCKQSLTRIKKRSLDKIRDPEERLSVLRAIKIVIAAIKESQYVITALRKEISKDRIKGVPVIQLFAELGDNDLYCKHCGNLVWHEGQGYVVKYCDNCGKLLDWSQFV